MSLNRFAARRDIAEKPIKRALEICGADVWSISGKGQPDLLVLWRGRWQPLEVKSGKADGQRKTPRLTKAQKGDEGKPKWPVVETIPQAFAAVGIQFEVTR